MVRIKINHLDGDCPRVTYRIACDACGYPFSEARFFDEMAWLRHKLGHDDGYGWGIELTAEDSGCG